MRRTSRRPFASNRHNSTRSACLENSAKLTPWPSHVAPSGYGWPGQTAVIEVFISSFSREPLRLTVTADASRHPVHVTPLRAAGQVLDAGMLVTAISRPPALEQVGGPFAAAETEGEREREHHAAEQDEKGVAHDLAADLHLLERDQHDEREDG